MENMQGNRNQNNLNLFSLISDYSFRLRSLSMQSPDFDAVAYGLHFVPMLKLVFFNLDLKNTIDFHLQ